MVLEAASFEARVTLKLPSKKKKEALEWEAPEMPTIPVLLNKKALKEHVRLVVHLPERKEKKS